ncbi:ribonuclease H-like domain-containing protein [Tanacetum coccineum]|uniref:Ribonuclease H-like domain-containing protein n=1 Tax=Tanacetum coccineum TaxID=301880 RepID=A0ABQ4Z9M5_9ASTR
MKKRSLSSLSAADKETVSAVLMTEREAKQMPIYFVSRALRGPKVNYTSMEKLVLALVHASKRLKRFDATNNEAEYEALIAGLKIAEQMGVKNLQANVDSRLVANQVPRSENKKADALSKIASTSFAHLSKQVLVEELKEKSISTVEVLAVVEEEGDTWMTPIFKYLMDGTLPAEVKKARAVKRKSWRLHAGTSVVIAKALAYCYYWPTMHEDARKLIRACQDCQVHKPVPRSPQQKLSPITSPWPFYKWGIDIAGPFPEGPEKVERNIPNGDALQKCILKGPYTPTIVTTPVVPATENSLAVPEQTTVETVMNMTPENRAHFESGKEAIHLILTGIGDEIYSTVDACQTTQEMWEAIERIQQEWLRFITIVKQQHKLDEVSYHKLFDILKQYQKEVNELRAERMAKNANPLALVATAQILQDPYYQSSKSHKSYAPTSKASLPTRSHATTRYKGKEIAKPITPSSESPSEEDSDHEQAQRDKDMQKNLALITKLTVGKSEAVNVARNAESKRVKDITYHKEKMFCCVNKLEESNLKSITNTCALETGDSNVIPDSPDMCDNDIQDDQNDVECDDERVGLANLNS